MIMMMMVSCVVYWPHIHIAWIHNAASNGSTSLIEQCIKAGLNVNAVNNVSQFIVR